MHSEHGIMVAACSQGPGLTPLSRRGDLLSRGTPTCPPTDLSHSHLLHGSRKSLGFFNRKDLHQALGWRTEEDTAKPLYPVRPQKECGGSQLKTKVRRPMEPLTKVTVKSPVKRKGGQETGRSRASQGISWAIAFQCTGLAKSPLHFFHRVLSCF